MIFWLRVLIPAVVSGVTQVVAKSRLETPDEKFNRLLGYLSLEDYATIAAMVMAQENGDLEELLCALDPQEVNRIYNLTECIKIEMQEDLPR